MCNVSFLLTSHPPTSNPTPLVHKHDARRVFSLQFRKTQHQMKHENLLVLILFATWARAWYIVERTPRTCSLGFSRLKRACFETKQMPNCYPMLVDARCSILCVVQGAFTHGQLQESLNLEASLSYFLFYKTVSFTPTCSLFDLHSFLKYHLTLTAKYCTILTITGETST